MYDPPTSLWQALLVFALIALGVVALRLRVHRREADRLGIVRNHLLERNNKLRDELRIAAAERDTAIAELDPVLTENTQLREELHKSLTWRNELRTAADEQAAYLMNRPHPHKTREERERDAWNSRWQAVFDAPHRIPPHEQRQDGADQ